MLCRVGKLASKQAEPGNITLTKRNDDRRRQQGPERRTGIAKPQTELPADYEQRLIKNDFAWASKNRDGILTEWRKRYDGKSEKVAGQ